jgi:hypothetical protein
VSVTFVVCETEPDVAFTVTVYFPKGVTAAALADGLPPQATCDPKPTTSRVASRNPITSFFLLGRCVTKPVPSSAKPKTGSDSA